MNTIPPKYVPYFNAVCNLPGDIQMLYLKSLKVASIIVCQHLTTTAQIRGVFAQERLTKKELDCLTRYFPTGLGNFPR
jgi:hypothetical protein